MSDQKKPKVTIGPDGTIHVDNGDHTPQTASGTSKTASAGTKTAQTSPSPAARVKPNSSTGSVEFRNTSPQAASSSAAQNTSDEKPGCWLTGCGFIVGGTIFLLLMCSIGAGLAVILPFITGPASIILGAIIAAGICYWWINKS